MNIGALTTMMCANMAIQNSVRIQKNRREEEERARKVQPTFQSTFNKEKEQSRRNK